MACPICLLTGIIVALTMPWVIVSRWYMAQASILSVSLWAVFRLSGRIGSVARYLWQSLKRGFSPLMNATYQEQQAVKKKTGAHSLKIAIVETAPSWPPGSMKAYADLVHSALKYENGLKIKRINLAPPVKMARLIPAMGGIWGRHLWAAIFGPWKLRNAGVDLYHILDGGYAYLNRFCGNKPVIVTAHDIIPLLQMHGLFPVPPPSLLGRFIIERCKSGWERADHIIAVSKNTQKDLTSNCRIEKDVISVVHNAIPSNYIQIAKDRGEDVAAAGEKKKAPYILNVGNNGYYKNRVEALRVFKQVKSEARLRLIMVGPEPSQDMRDCVRQNNLEMVVDFIVDPSHECLAELYCGARLFLFPSLYEGFGWPPLEAMLFGCPVVCSNSGSLPEVVKSAALTAPPNDTEAMARQCLKILRNDSFAEGLIEKGRRQVEKFSLERMRIGILEAYGKCLRNRGRRSED